ncbi:hypothetical protein JKG47_05030 [Acidithiobacillus sp. MC6.1]|nr:hypothetical protein [Acidithiobacillus sp. MC6.1]
MNAGSGPKKRLLPMSVDQILEIDRRIKKLGENGTPSVVPGRLIPGIVAKKAAQTMAYHADIPDAVFVHEFIDIGFTSTTARQIVKKARALSLTIEVPVMVPQPVASSTTVPVPTSGGVVVGGKEKVLDAVMPVSPAITPAVSEEPKAKPNLTITYENNSHALGHLSDYVLAFPETLPKPSQILPFEPQIKIREKTTLKSIREDLFTQEYGLTRRLENRAEITAMNPCGFFEPNGHTGSGAAAIEDFGLFTAMRGAIGEWRIDQPQLAEFLPYLADEGLLEYHSVSLKAVRKLEDMRQRLIANGTIQEYDRTVPPALPMPRK